MKRLWLRIFQKSTDKGNTMYIKQDKNCKILCGYVKGNCRTRKIKEILKAVIEKDKLSTMNTIGIFNRNIRIKQQVLRELSV